ncbi:TPA: hypothetical protein N0F65_011143 [Lagenidium giganteum]|uniref:Uncharacterized protein n=1 Tax=Lagenidium giganteum TaxID=4803 RepID=A0AAV2Z6W6_9STRA|nr:TPA: hypothetical protein N0F65_011143 [Lagenidium giganteum]
MTVWACYVVGSWSGLQAAAKATSSSITLLHKPTVRRVEENVRVEGELGDAGGNGKHSAAIPAVEVVTKSSPLKRLALHTQAEEATALATREIAVAASTEQWDMMDDFYTSAFASNDTSTTVIFNVFKGSPDALAMQLDLVSKQSDVDQPHVWVTCFNSPMEREYASVVQRFQQTTLPDIVFTVSTFNHKFHGRFLLAYMAKTKYVLVVDDDRMIDETTIRDYIRYMQQQPGLWGNFGHLRAKTFAGYKSWPNVGYDLSRVDYAEQDYLSGMWFLEQRWLEYFVKERPPSWATAEHMHLSHVLRKYLNLNTYGGVVAMQTKKLPNKQHAATVGKALDLREFVFDHQLGRGNKVANVPQPIQSLVYAETVADIDDFISKLNSCQVDSTMKSAPWCQAGKTAAVFRGAAEQDVNGLIAASKRLCALTKCEYVSLKPKIQHVIRYFNMREGYGQQGMDIPWQTGASDVLQSLTGILNNLMPERFFFPDVDHVTWHEAIDSTKRNRLHVYHNVVRLALQIHVDSKPNPKWEERFSASGGEHGYPRIRVLKWRQLADTTTIHDGIVIGDWKSLVEEIAL